MPRQIAGHLGYLCRNGNAGLNFCQSVNVHGIYKLRNCLYNDRVFSRDFLRVSSSIVNTQP